MLFFLIHALFVQTYFGQLIFVLGVGCLWNSFFLCWHLIIRNNIGPPNMKRNFKPHVLISVKIDVSKANDKISQCSSCCAAGAWKARGRKSCDLATAQLWVLLYILWNHLGSCWEKLSLGQQLDFWQWIWARCCFSERCGLKTGAGKERFKKCIYAHFNISL